MLIEWFKENTIEKSMVAFSGGVDSSVVAYASKLALGGNAIAVTADYKTLSRDELEEAKIIAKEIGIKHVIIEYNELNDINFIVNDRYRCYYCRENLAKHLLDVARDYNCTLIVDGTNIDDLRDERHGIIAMREHKIRSPLVELGIDKLKVREIAKALGLSNWNKPSNSCLASRIGRGINITYERLKRIEEAEKIVKMMTGAKQVRVRDHDSIARIEIGRDERHLMFDTNILDAIDSKLKMLGFKFVTIDAMGYKSGSMNILQ